MTNGINDVVKAFTILGSIVSIKALIDSQRDKSAFGPGKETEELRILRRLETALKYKGIID